VRSVRASLVCPSEVQERRPAAAASTRLDGMTGLIEARLATGVSPPTDSSCSLLAGCQLTTPHKLQAEARPHNPARAVCGVCP
jgi:hypothetical protein